MADLTPEVANALVRLMNGEVDYAELDDEALFVLGATVLANRETLYRLATTLNDRGHTFATIAARWGVHEATASRLAKPPAEDRRRRGDR